jgi:16S rRNA (guanine527-N7)-methyltransferase
MIESGRAQAVALLGDLVSRETWDRLESFVQLVIERQKTLNLVAASTIPQIWTRHIADSLQLLSLAPEARTWIDLGAGAGFPGLVIACALVDCPEARVSLGREHPKRQTSCATWLILFRSRHCARARSRLNRKPAASMSSRPRAGAARQALDYQIPCLKRGALGLFP